MIIPNSLVATELSIIPYFFHQKFETCFSLLYWPHPLGGTAWIVHHSLNFILASLLFCLLIYAGGLHLLLEVNDCQYVCEAHVLCLAHLFSLHFKLRYKASCWSSLAGWPKDTRHSSYPRLALSVVGITSDLIEHRVLVDDVV